MTIIDVLKFNRELFERMRSAGVRIDDVRYIDLHADIKSMTDAGDKRLMPSLWPQTGITCQRDWYMTL